MKFTHTQILEALNKLPQQTRERITSQEITDATIRVAEKNNIPKEKILAFSSAVGTVLLGLLHKEKLAEQLVAELQLPQDKAAVIATEVEKEIFNTNIRMDTNLRMSTNKTESTKPPLPPTPSPKGRESNLPLGEAGGVAPSPLGRAGGGVISPPRHVLIRKEIPPPLLRQGYAGQAPQIPTVQSLLSDIRRGTAYDEGRVGEAFRKTPIEVKQSLESVGFLSRLQGVSKKFGLNVEETGELVSETGLVMLGLTQPIQFVDNLVRRLRLPRDRAMAVGQAVNMEILRPVREILRKMGNTNKTEDGLRFAPPANNSPLEGSPPEPVRAGTPTENRRRDVFQDPYREPIN